MWGGQFGPRLRSGPSWEAALGVGGWGPPLCPCRPDPGPLPSAGSSTQVSVLLLPFCVVLAWGLGKPLDLNYR